jgi:hypothetical protein
VQSWAPCTHRSGQSVGVACALASIPHLVRTRAAAAASELLESDRLVCRDSRSGDHERQNDVELGGDVIPRSTPTRSALARPALDSI